MSESIQKMFESFNELFDYSKQMAVGSETLARIHVDDVEVGTTDMSRLLKRRQLLNLYLLYMV